jgi:hypothetical protein
MKRLLKIKNFANCFITSSCPTDSGFHLTLGRPFASKAESPVPESIERVAAQYRETYAQEMERITQVQELDLARILETPFLPGRSFSFAQVLIQVCMHSHGSQPWGPPRNKEIPFSV